MEENKTEKNNAAQMKALVEVCAPKVKELKYGEGENEFKFNVYPVLPFRDRIQVVKDIVDGVFMDKQDTVYTYAPEFETLVKRYAVVSHYTDLSLPDSLDDIWLVLHCTTIYEDVVKAVGEAEIEDVLGAADKTIDTYRRYVETKTDINSFMNKIGETFKDFDAKVSKEDVSAMIEEIKKIAQIRKGE